MREHQRASYGLEPEDVLITFGATEAIASALLGLCDPGDEVVMLDPSYDSYRAAARFAGAQPRPVMLAPPEFRVTPGSLQAAIGPRARVLLLNSPHNPTGRVLDRVELELIAAACIEHDLICVTDEVGEDATAFCATLPERCGVVAIPTGAFSAEPPRLRGLVRFAFCKPEPVIAQAARQLAGLRA